MTEVESLAERIVKTLSSYLGQTAARASLRMFLEKRGVHASALGHEHLSQLVETLKPGLKVFVGAANAEAVTGEILGLGKEG